MPRLRGTRYECNNDNDSFVVNDSTTTMAMNDKPLPRSTTIINNGIDYKPCSERDASHSALYKESQDLLINFDAVADLRDDDEVFSELCPVRIL